MKKLELAVKLISCVLTASVAIWIMLFIFNLIQIGETRLTPTFRGQKSTIVAEEIPSATFVSKAVFAGNRDDKEIHVALKGFILPSLVYHDPRSGLAYREKLPWITLDYVVRGQKIFRIPLWRVVTILGIVWIVFFVWVILLTALLEWINETIRRAYDRKSVRAFLER